jgi:hypothetical protein
LTGNLPGYGKSEGFGKNLQVFAVLFRFIDFSQGLSRFIYGQISFTRMCKSLNIVERVGIFLYLKFKSHIPVLNQIKNKNVLSKICLMTVKLEFFTPPLHKFEICSEIAKICHIRNLEAVRKNPVCNF